MFSDQNINDLRNDVIDHFHYVLSLDTVIDVFDDFLHSIVLW